MTKALREGKVFFDWSQNAAAKTTIAPYSMRGREHPMVAVPRTWDELAAGDLVHLDYRQVMARVAAGIDPLGELHGQRAQAARTGARPSPTSQSRPLVIKARPGRVGSSRSRPGAAARPEDAAARGVELDLADGAESDVGLAGQSRDGDRPGAVAVGG